jgi:ATP-dependent RNA helicase DDX35
LATRVAEEAGCRLGDKVGYTVRFDDQTSPQTHIKYVTDGILLREATLQDPLLSNYSVVILDETHERNLNTDTLLGLLKKIRRQRKDLRMIICSATIDAQRFLDFFVSSGPTSDEGDTAQGQGKKSRWGPKVSEERVPPPSERGTIISVDGRQHAVDILFSRIAVSNYIESTVDTCVKIHRHESMGDVLCFLPTGEDIDQVVRLAEEAFQDDLSRVEFLPLYGTLPQHVLSRVFQPKQKDSKRRFIFATNIAETSVTVPNISFVVDAGLVKLPYFDPVTGLERLIVHETSQASAAQRSGRAGRIRPGKCFRLYTEAFLVEKMMAHTPPEMLRTNLTSFLLTLKALGIANILAFDLMDQPSVNALSHGLETLYALGAMDDRTQLTERGLDLSVFPTEPRVSRMLLESLREGCSWEVLGVAGALQVRALLHKPHDRRQQQLLDYQQSVADIVDASGDHVTFVNLLSAMEDQHWNETDCRERFVNYMALRRALEVRRQLAGFLRQFGRVQALGLADGSGVERSQAIRRCLTAGFFANVAKLDNDGRYYTLRKRVLVTPSSQSVLMTHGGVMSSEYIVFGETIDGSRGGIELKIVSKIEARWLRELAPHYWE